METSYRNKNRGYQQLRVWHDAIDHYVITCRVFKRFQYGLRRVGAHDSITPTLHYSIPRLFRTGTSGC